MAWAISVEHVPAPIVESSPPQRSYVAQTHLPTIYVFFVFKAALAIFDLELGLAMAEPCQINAVGFVGLLSPTNHWEKDDNQHDCRPSEGQLPRILVKF
jgi:hypothetical protein